MKTNIKYILSAFAFSGLLLACSPDEFDGADINGIPELNIEPIIDVDIEMNQVTFSLPAGTKDVMPVWIFTENKGTDKEKKVYSTVDGLQKIFAQAGTYEVEFKLMNRNGQSDASRTYSFVIPNSLFDFTPYVAKLSKGNWHIANKEKGHMACGPSGDNPAEWWSAGPDEKKDFGVYDNVLIFDEEHNYTFDPGEAGTMYVNWGVTVNGWQSQYWSGVENDDYNVPAEKQQTTYDFAVDGNDVYLTLPAGTNFPYIAFDDIWNQPRYKIVNLTPKKMTLIAENPGAIAWQFILTTEDTVERVFAGFTYDQPDNIWKNIEVQAGGIYYADASWTPYPDNGGATFNVSNQENKVILPLATANQWQAQFPIITNIGPGNPNMTSAKHYDFSCVINSNKDLDGFTLKLVETGDNGVPGSLGIAYDANAVFYDNSTNLKAYEDYVFYIVDQPGVDIQDHLLQLVMDFGGCAEGTEVTVSNIVLIEHDKNTELDKVPGETPDVPTPDKPVVEWSGENLLLGMIDDITQYYAPGWAQIDDAEYTAKDGVYTIKYPAATTDQWQAQFTFNRTGISLDPAKTYDFRVKIVSTTDHPGVTVKLTQQDNDNVFLTQDRHALTAYEEEWIEIVDMHLTGDGEITDLKMPFDFGGCAANTEITISDMYLQEHVGPRVVAWDLTGEKNLWNKGSHETLSFYYAPGWAQIDDPETVVNGNSYTIKLPKATSDQWQAQWHLSTDLGVDDIVAGQKYDVRFTIYSNAEQPGITFKLTENGNDNNFLTADRHAYVEAYEEQVVEIQNCELSLGNIANPTFKLALDFAGNPDNSEITIKDIIIQAAE